MKALLKSGDTERIIFFANVSRQNDIFVLAGNYLQTLDWRSHPEYVKHIVTFYTRAKAPQLLRGFYEACAQAEIDEYQNYESALNALKEAQKIQSKTPENNQPNNLEAKLTLLEKIINLKVGANSNPKEGVAQLEALLKSSDLQLGIIQEGNIYALIFNIQLQHKLDEEAQKTLNAMKQNTPNFIQYLDQETLSTLSPDSQSNEVSDQSITETVTK